MCNAVTGGDLKIRTEIYEKTHGDVLRSFLKALRINDARLMLNIIEGLDNLLGLDELLGMSNSDSSVAMAFERMDGLDVMDDVMKHPSMDVYNSCNNLLNKYFS